MENIMDIVGEIAADKGLRKDDVLNLVTKSIIDTAKEHLGDYEYFTQKDETNKNMRLFRTMSVVNDNDERIVENPNLIGIQEAKSIANTQNVQIGDNINIEIPLKDMNKTVVNKLFFNLNNNLQYQLEENIIGELRQHIGKIIVGNVIGVDKDENTFIEIRSLRGVMSQKNRIKNEHFTIGKTIRCILKRVNLIKGGIEIELSRTTPKFLEELMKQEVPEIEHGEVEIIKSARIPGNRAKVALLSHNPRIDPIGSSVGVKGVRINAVSGELNGENIDCIEYSDIPEIFIAKSLAPANIISVKIESSPTQTESNEEETPRPKAIVTIEPIQKAKAIGKNGVNIRLASMLTGYDIEIVELNSAEDKNDKREKPGIEALESLFN